jgi:para-nitrobenzyl esterase
MDTIVTTTHGQVHGFAADGVCAFLDLSWGRTAGRRQLAPAAATRPAMDRRPRRHRHRSRTTSFAVPREDPTGMLFDPAVRGVDCLEPQHLDARPGASGLPVMAASPGGSFHCSSGGSYDGSRFAGDGVVCVRMNWRTGADGSFRRLV